MKKTEVRSKRIEIKSKTKEYLTSVKHSNNLIDVIDHLKASKGTSKYSITCILGLETMLTHSLSTRLTNNTQDLSDTEKLYREWLISQYEETISEFMNLLKSSDTPPEVREQLMVSTMKLLCSESQTFNPPEPESRFCLPKTKFMNLLEALIKIENRKDFGKIAARFGEYSSMFDVALQIWDSIGQLTKVSLDQNAMRNALAILEVTAIPDAISRNKQPNNIFVKARVPFKKATDKALKEYISVVWNNIKNWPHSKATLQITLVLLLEKLMPHLKEPILLTDFFITSMDSGGAISVLALQGIFKLIQEQNIDYPNIYDKMYNLFTPDIFETKYKARLFFLADIFLTSTYLPEAMVAAFAKRLARLALLAPGPDSLIIIRFIGNLLIRHKGLQILINHTTGELVQDDPFLENEVNPVKSKAMESSLWELKTLQMHVLPAVAIAARFIEEKLPSVEWDLADLLEATYPQMFEKERDKTSKVISLTFVRPDFKTLYLDNELRLLPVSVET